MWRSAVRVSPSFVFPIFGRRYENDYDLLDHKAPSDPDTGVDRLKKMFTRNEYGEISLEIQNVVQSSMTGAFFGAIIGGTVRSRVAYLNFIENNQATIFTTTFHAKKKLQDHVTVAFATGAYQWGWRLSAFTGLFSLIATTISVYRGNTSLVEYITAGALTGGLYKANLGLAATLVGAGLGAALSTVAGLAILGILKMTGFSMDDIRRALCKIREAREDQMKQAIDKASEIKNDELTLHHDALIEEKGAEKMENL